MRNLGLAVALVFVAHDVPATEPVGALRLAGELQPGRFGVGFRKERFGAVSPPVDLYLWYPTAKTSESNAGPGLVFADYYRIQEANPPGRDQMRDWLRTDMTSPPGIGLSQLDAILDAAMWARSDTTPAAGRHPLVLWSYRDSVPTMQALLNEYLASHGYVVAFAWPVDNAPALPWATGLTAEDRRRSLESQIALLENVLDALALRPWVDTQQTAVVSWSYGGESAGGLQRRRKEVRLALGIDSTLVSGWVFAGTEELAALDRSELTAPYALIRHGRARIGGDETVEPPLLSAVPAGAWYIRLPQLSHGNFNFPGGMLPGVLGLGKVSEWAVGGEAAKRGYEAICRLVLGLLEGEPAEIEEPAGLLEIRRHPPQQMLRTPQSDHPGEASSGD